MQIEPGFRNCSLILHFLMISFSFIQKKGLCQIPFVHGIVRGVKDIGRQQGFTGGWTQLDGSRKITSGIPTKRKLTRSVTFRHGKVRGRNVSFQHQPSSQVDSSNTIWLWLLHRHHSGGGGRRRNRRRFCSCRRRHDQEGLKEKKYSHVNSNR